MFHFQIAGKPAQALKAFESAVADARKAWSGAQAEEKQLESVLAAVRDEINQHALPVVIRASVDHGKEKARTFTVSVTTIEGWAD